MAGPSVPTPPAPPTNLEPAIDSRTELQAQFALLAVQLAELSETENNDDHSDDDDDMEEII